MGATMRQVRSRITLSSTGGLLYPALVLTVIGIGEEESRQDGRSGEASQVDGSKRDYIYGTGSYHNWHR
jgi:hypothetical protein